tara:strand:+ start:2038 stop:3003 length:966 start_codon:yes stop_codon:yes gene_type:complete
MRVLFMGTSNFAVPSFEKLISEKFDIVGVVTQPDRPSGRGRKLQASPIKLIAEKNKLNIFQPEKVREKSVVSQLKRLEPDVIVVIAFGQILPRAILDIPSSGCFNIHPSLLPKYRGAAPIQWALINGETETGITIMLLDEGEDTGDIILQKRSEIDPETDAILLYQQLGNFAPNLLIHVLRRSIDQLPMTQPQENSLATYAPQLTKEHGNVNWNKSAVEILNLVRGTAIWPQAHAFLRDNLHIKILSCSLMSINSGKTFPPGTIEISRNKQVIVHTARGKLILAKVQPATKNKMSAHDFVNGYRIKTGDRFISSSQKNNDL